MSTPTVSEITRRPEPVAHDAFIDDLRVVVRGGSGVTGSRKGPRR
jgi:hypothetical protein